MKVVLTLIVIFVAAFAAAYMAVELSGIEIHRPPAIIEPTPSTT